MRLDPREESTRCPPAGGPQHLTAQRPAMALLENGLDRKRRGLLESSGGQGQGAKQGQRDRAKARGNRTQETFTRRLMDFKWQNRLHL